MDDLVVLVHSPLVGPFTWSLVAPTGCATRYMGATVEKNKMPIPTGETKHS